MRAVSIERVVPGMAVARSIIGANGEVLLAKGNNLNEHYICRLKELGILSLYVTDETIGDIEADDVISEQTRLAAKQMTKQAMHDIKVGAKFNAKKMSEVVENLIDEIMNSPNMVVCLVDIRAMNDYTFAHSVNVAVLSVVTGLAMGYARDKLRQLAVGALFHDIGKILINEEELAKYANIERDPSEDYKKHTNYGFDILKKVPNINLLSAHVGFQHHERMDGSGYPRGLKGAEINEFAKIVAVADAYDNLTSDLPNRPRMMPQSAIEFLTLNSSSWFDPFITKTFIENVAVFPVGTLVLLNSGEKGIVTRVNKRFPTRPFVRIIKDSNDKLIKPPYEVDLMEAHAYFLTKVISDDEL